MRTGNGSLLGSVLGFLKDPPPEFVFEVAADGIAVSRTRPPTAIRHAPLKSGVIAPSLVKENILDPAAFAEAVRQLTPPATGRGKRRAALILPDNCVRIAVLDFDALPDKEEERRPLINFRLRKSVPFDIDEAALSYFPQAGKKVIVALAPSEIVAHYETPFRAAGLLPGLVTVSALAMVELLPVSGSIVLAHHSPGALTVIALSDGVVTIARTLEMGSEDTDPLEEIVAAIYPTLAYIEDQTRARPEKLFVAGFGERSEPASTRLAVELDIPVEAIHDRFPGLAGYLASVTPRRAAA
jgi:type IV pilus assembly protein PilM